MRYKFKSKIKGLRAKHTNDGVLIIFWYYTSHTSALIYTYQDGPDTQLWDQ